MPRKFHFITGLPRSGSTLLSAILNQNPRFHANISDPLQSYIHSINRDTNTAAGMDVIVPIEKRREMMRDLFQSFYKDENLTCFNTNRGWAADTALLKDLFPDFRMIVCVRDVPSVLNSFERLNHANPHTVKPIYHHNDLSTVHDRCAMLMGEVPNAAGYVRAPLMNVQQSMFTPETAEHIRYLDYDALVANPEIVMRNLYAFIGENYYDRHDYKNVEASYDEFDDKARIAGLHTVRPIVAASTEPSMLPTELINRYSGFTFWRQPDFDHSRIKWLDHAVDSSGGNPIIPKPTIKFAQRQL